MIWGSHSSRDAGMALYPLQPSLAQRLSAPPHHSRTGNPSVAPPKKLWAPPVLPAPNSALKNHRYTYKEKKKEILNHSSQNKRSKQIHTKKAKRIQLPKADTICLWFILCLTLPTSRSNFWKGSSKESTWFYQQRECPAICPAHLSDCFLSGVELTPLWELGASTMTEENYCIVKCIGSFSPALDSCFDPEIGKPRHKSLRRGWSPKDAFLL